MATEAAVGGFRILPTHRSVTDTLTRVELLARSRGLKIFARVDFSADAARSGLSLRPTGLIIVGIPKDGTPLMIATPTAAIDLPLKVLAWEDADGRTWVAYNKPSYLQAGHGFPPELIENVSAIAKLAEVAVGEDTWYGDQLFSY